MSDEKGRPKQSAELSKPPKESSKKHRPKLLKKFMDKKPSSSTGKDDEPTDNQGLSGTYTKKSTNTEQLQTGQTQKQPGVPGKHEQTSTSTGLQHQTGQTQGQPGVPENHRQPTPPRIDTTGKPHTGPTQAQQEYHGYQQTLQPPLTPDIMPAIINAERENVADVAAALGSRNNETQYGTPKDTANSGPTPSALPTDQQNIQTGTQFNNNSASCHQPSSQEQHKKYEAPKAPINPDSQTTDLKKQLALIDYSNNSYQQHTGGKQRHKGHSNYETIDASKVDKTPQPENLKDISTIKYKLSDCIWALKGNRHVVTSNQLTMEHITIGANKSSSIKTQTVLLVGQTGSGKTTMVDGILNYVYKGGPPNIIYTMSQLQAKPTVQKLFCHTFVPIEGSRLKHCINVIDTPGLGAEDVGNDETIINVLKQVLCDPMQFELPSIDAIWIILQATLTRLTPSEQYLLGMLKEILRKEDEYKLQIVLTFSDGQANASLQGLEEMNIAHQKFYHTNNVTLSTTKNKFTDLIKLFVNMNETSFKLLLDEKFAKDLDHVKKTQTQVEPEKDKDGSDDESRIPLELIAQETTPPKYRLGNINDDVAKQHFVLIGDYCDTAKAFTYFANYAMNTDVTKEWYNWDRREKAPCICHIGDYEGSRLQTELEFFIQRSNDSVVLPESFKPKNYISRIVLHIPTCESRGDENDVLGIQNKFQCNNISTVNSNLTPYVNSSERQSLDKDKPSAEAWKDISKSIRNIIKIPLKPPVYPRSPVHTVPDDLERDLKDKNSESKTKRHSDVQSRSPDKKSGQPHRSSQIEKTDKK